MDIIIKKEVEDYWFYEPEEECFVIIFKVCIRTIELTTDKSRASQILIEDTNLENALQQAKKICFEKYGDKDGIREDDNIGWDIIGIIQTGDRITRIEALEPEE